MIGGMPKTERIEHSLVGGEDQSFLSQKKKNVVIEEFFLSILEMK
jgi:hypothetical protein